MSNLMAISCATDTLCMVVSSQTSTTYNGKQWSSTIPAGTHTLYDLSCLSSTFCVALDQEFGFLIYGTDGWSSRHRVERRGWVASGISCGSTQFCADVDEGGRALPWHGHQFGKPQRLYPPKGFSGFDRVSGSSESFCMAAYWNGDTVEYAV